MPNAVRLDTFVAEWGQGPLSALADAAAWDVTRQADAVVRRLLAALSRDEYRVTDEVAVHVSATVEAGAILKGPLILGAHCFVAASAYLRGGNWVSNGCVLGPGVELKSSFLFSGTKLAHFNFVGDSILGADVNLEAGSVICNHRNERAEREIRVLVGDRWCSTGVDKFGAVVGDHGRIGANAVIAPGSLLPHCSVVGRTSLHDEDPCGGAPPRQ